MKKRLTSATIVLAALLAIVCFAVMKEQSKKSSSYAAVLGRIGLEIGDQFESNSIQVIQRKQFFKEVVANKEIRESAGISYEEFLSKMEKLDEKYDSEIFAENAEILFGATQKNGFTEYLIPTIFVIETFGGKRLKGEYNYWNAIERKEEHFEFRNFDSPEESIEALSDTLSKYYYNGTTIEDFVNVWSPDYVEYGISIYVTMEMIENL